MTIPYHSLARCAGTPCPIHAPSRHHMTDWPMTVRASGLTERIRPHGVGHPDPDSVAWLDSHGRTGYGLHGCDGCCQETAS